MPTERGWAVMGAGVSLIVLWTLFGEIELGVTGILLVAAVIMAIGFVAMHRPHLGVARRIGASAIHEGEHAAVTLLITNHGGVVRHLKITDEVGRLGTADFAIGTVPAGRSVTASYRVLCRPRGVYAIGPSILDITDPFGLASVSGTAGPADQLVVYPAVEKLEGHPLVRGRSQALHAARPEHSQRGGEDFYTLRAYQHGDDLRRVHWPSSARRDELMIRQLETPWQARALVVLDVRSSAYEDLASFEHAVSGAASVVRHLNAGGFDADLWAGGELTDASHYDASMRNLAMAEPSDGTDLPAAWLKRSNGGGALVLVGGRPDHPLQSLQGMLAPSYPTTVLMSAATTTSSLVPTFQRAGVVTLITGPDQPWAPAWAKAMRSTWHSVSAG